MKLSRLALTLALCALIVTTCVTTFNPALLSAEGIATTASKDSEIIDREYKDGWSEEYFEKYGFTEYEDRRELISQADVLSILSKMSNKPTTKEGGPGCIDFTNLAFILDEFDLLGEPYSDSLNLTPMGIAQGNAIINSYFFEPDPSVNGTNVYVHKEQFLALCNRVAEINGISTEVVKNSFCETLNWI